jgi:hypothetical protein
MAGKRPRLGRATSARVVPGLPGILAFVLVVLVWALSLSFSLYFICALVFSGARLIDLKPEERAIMREPRAASSGFTNFLIRLMGFPVLIDYARRSRLRHQTILFLSYLSSFAFAVVNILIIVDPAGGLTGVTSIVASCRYGRDCYDSFALAALGTAITFYSLIVVLLLGFGAITQKLVRWLLRFSLERVQRIDVRAPVLFLRAFRGDPIPLYSPRIGLMATLMELGKRKTNLDQMLLEVRRMDRLSHSAILARSIRRTAPRGVISANKLGKMR